MEAAARPCYSTPPCAARRCRVRRQRYVCSKRNFADPRVGAVTGESRYEIGADDASTESEGAYWSYEIWIKGLESSLGSVVGGDGAIYAIRRGLYRDLAPGDLSDFVNPLQIVAQGYRNVYEPAAVSWEGGAGYGAEFRRKVRIVNRAWRATFKMRALLNPSLRLLPSVPVPQGPALAVP
jgi:hypothetical protein